MLTTCPFFRIDSNERAVGESVFFSAIFHAFANFLFCDLLVVPIKSRNDLQSTYFNLTLSVFFKKFGSNVCNEVRRANFTDFFGISFFKVSTAFAPSAFS